MYSELLTLAQTDVPAPMLIVLGLALTWPGVLGIVHRAQTYRYMRMVFRENLGHDRPIQVTETRTVSRGYTRTVALNYMPAPKPDPPPPTKPAVGLAVLEDPRA